MTLQKLFFIIFIGELFVKNGMFFNPLLTYTMRFHKITAIPNITGNSSVNQYREKQYVIGDLKINSEALINKVITTFHRCNPEGFNCEYFQSWTFSNICEQLKQDNQLWSRWTKTSIPPLICPIDKVYYKINATVDIGIALAIYPDATDYSWRVILNGYSYDTFVGGIGVEASFFGYRKRNKSIFKNE